MQFQRLRGLNEKVTQWGTDRNFFAEDGACLKGQVLKLNEEFRELMEAIQDNNKEEAKDAIGDMLVVINMICNLVKLPVNDVILDFHYHIGKPWELIHKTTKDVLLISTLVAKNKPADLIRDALLYVVTDLNVIAAAYNTNITVCYQAAFDTIEHRKGKMVKGTYIKEEDLV